MLNKETIGKMKKGAYLINTARGGICDRDAVAEALESGQLLGDFNARQSNIDSCTILSRHMIRKSDCDIQNVMHVCVLLSVWLLWWSIHPILVGMWLLMLYTFALCWVVLYWYSSHKFLPCCKVCLNHRRSVQKQGHNAVCARVDSDLICRVCWRCMGPPAPP